MNKRTILAAAAAAGVIAAAGSAFTATSTIDQATKTVGATSQTISGVAVTNVQYTWDSTTDATSGVTFTVGSAPAGGSTMVVSLDGTAGDCTNTLLDYTCTWTTPVVNATKLSIVVS